MLSPASISAAKCITPSKRPALRVFSSSVRSATSPSTNSAASATAKRLLWQRLSYTVTPCPWPSSSLQTVPPIYPAPPVINTFIHSLLGSLLGYHISTSVNHLRLRHYTYSSEGQSPGTGTFDVAQMHGACYNLFPCRLRLSM